MKAFRTILLENGVSFNETGSNQLIFSRCFNCGKSKKLYCDADKGFFDCKSCLITGKGTFLLSRLLDIPHRKAIFIVKGEEVIDISETTELEDEFRIRSKGIKSLRPFKREKPKPIKFDSHIVRLKPSHLEAQRYLLKRGVTPEIQEQLNLHVSEYTKRIYLPVEIDGELIGHLGRDYSGEAEWKVLNASGGWRSSAVWNYDNVIDTEELIICEGAFSAIKCGINRSIALMGKTLSNEQVDLIRSTGAKSLVLALDVGTEEAQEKMFSVLTTYFPGKIRSVKFPEVKSITCPHCRTKNTLSLSQITKPLPCGHDLTQIEAKALWTKAEFKDAGDYTPDENEEFIRAAKKFNPTGFEF
jgi:DNA primase